MYVHTYTRRVAGTPIIKAIPYFPLVVYCSGRANFDSSSSPLEVFKILTFFLLQVRFGLVWFWYSKRGTVGPRIVFYYILFEN